MRHDPKHHAAWLVLLGLAAGALASAASPTVAAMRTRPPLAAPPLPVTKAEYYCSPGFEPGRGGTCVAVASRAEVELYVDQPIYGGSLHYLHRARRHRRLRERY